MELIYAIANITAGILLALELLDKWDGDSDFFKKISKTLEPFGSIIGTVLIILSLIMFFDEWLFSVIGILGGILLIKALFAKMSSLQSGLNLIYSKLFPFKQIIGIILIIIGILGLLS